MEENNQINRYESVRTILKWAFVIVPLVAGLDKFTNILVDWQKYLAPFVAEIVPAQIFMYVVGIIEIAAALIVLKRTDIGALVVSGWLVAISLNLIIAGYYDIAVRDLVMALSAYSLYILAHRK